MKTFALSIHLLDIEVVSVERFLEKLHDLGNEDEEFRDVSIRPCGAYKRI
jgi:hypothetical protein